MTYPLPRPPLPPAADQPETVPPLEPPAPLGYRFTRAARRRQWTDGCRRGLPSWLASCVFHMAFIVVITSLAIPDVPRNVVVQLMAGWNQQAGEEKDEPAALRMPEEEGPAGKEQALLEPASVPDRESQQDKKPLPKPPVATENVDAAIPSPTTADPRPASVKRPDIVLAASGDRDVAARYGPIGPSETATEARRLDEVVDRFILYDINVLQGQPGQRALENFQELDTAAIPALVRGLNKATRYRSSCPAIVIGRKLDSALAATNDPALIRYAADNIGRGVPADGNHLSVLRGLVQKWGSDKDRVRGELRLLAKVAGDVEVTAEMVEQYQRLRGDNLDELVRQAGSAENIAKRRIAMMCLYQRTGDKGLEEQQRIALALKLVDLMRDSDEAIRGAAQGTLVHLADGKDHGDSADTWREHFKKLRFTRIERRSQDSLQMAKRLDEAGRKEAASVRFQQLIRDFPGTDAAVEARRILAEQGK